MDYRLVKQFSNNAIDNFFNFFYKIWDFFGVLLDLFWSFVDIWYQFFMIFINAWLYLYYLLLFILDKLSMAGLFTRKASARIAIPGSRAYRPDIVVPISPMFGKIELPKPAVKIPEIKIAAPSVQPKRSGVKRSYGRDFANSISNIARKFSRAIENLYQRIADALSSKLHPVKEEDSAQKKSLIDEYMREYERKKHR